MKIFPSLAFRFSSVIALASGVMALALPPRLLAQPILPALLEATSVDVAMSVVGAAKAAPNSRLELQFEEIALPGPLNIEAKSDIPGTTAMVLMAGAPSGWYGTKLPGERAPAAPLPEPGKPAAKPSPTVILAWQVPPGRKPVLRTTYARMTQRQAFTLLVSAQGRWYFAVREAKLACDASLCGRIKPARPVLAPSNAATP